MTSLKPGCVNVQSTPVGCSGKSAQLTWPYKWYHDDDNHNEKNKTDEQNEIDLNNIDQDNIDHDIFEIDNEKTCLIFKKKSDIKIKKEDDNNEKRWLIIINN